MNPDSLPSLASVSWERKPVVPDISVVIPTVGRAILESCLASVLLGNEWPACIVVVDQSSSPEIADLMRRVDELGVRTCYVPSTEHGRSRGLNVGIEHVDTPFLAITDDDCLVAPEWLGVLRSHLANHPQTVVTGRVEPGGHEEPMSFQPSREPALQVRPHLLHDNLVGGNMAAPKQIFERVGPFDESPYVRCAEDTEWAYRALRSQVPIFYAPDAWLVHYAWRPTDEREAQYRAYALSHGGFYGKYLRRGDYFIAARSMLHFSRALRRWARGVWNRDAEARAHGRAYATRLLPGIYRGLRSGRREVPR